MSPANAAFIFLVFLVSHIENYETNADILTKLNELAGHMGLMVSGVSG